MTTTEVLRQNRDPIERAARAGYAARGAVYLIIGYFAFKAAYSSGQAMGSKDAVGFVFGTVGGMVLLVVLVAALGAFSIWRVMQAGLDLDRHGTGAKGIAVRLGLLASAASYATLALFAGTLALGQSTGGEGVASQSMAMAFEAGYGQVVTIAIAILMAGAGVAHIVKGVTAGFEKYMRFPEGQAWLKPVCQFGLVARGSTFVLLGFLIVTGAVSYTSGETPGLEAALSAMAGWSFGWVFLALTGLGLFAFGVYALAQARYRRIRLDPTA